MMANLKRYLLFIFVTSLSLDPCIAAFADNEAAVDQWQLTRLFSPTKNDLKSESKGKIFIYSGLKDIDVDRALDQNFHRMQSMMFIKTIITNSDGEPKVDKETGVTLAEYDGCD